MNVLDAAIAHVVDDAPPDADGLTSSSDSSSSSSYSSASSSDSDDTVRYIPLQQDDEGEENPISRPLTCHGGKVAPAELVKKTTSAMKKKTNPSRATSSYFMSYMYPKGGIITRISLLQPIVFDVIPSRGHVVYGEHALTMDSVTYVASVDHRQFWNPVEDMLACWGYQEKVPSHVFYFNDISIQAKDLFKSIWITDFGFKECLDTSHPVFIVPTGRVQGVEMRIMLERQLRNTHRAENTDIFILRGKKFWALSKETRDLNFSFRKLKSTKKFHDWGFLMFCTMKRPDPTRHKHSRSPIISPTPRRATRVKIKSEYDDLEEHLSRSLSIEDLSHIQTEVHRLKESLLTD